MIQRIQSIFYLLAAICASFLFFQPLASSSKAGSPFMEDQLFNVQDHIVLIIVAALAVLLPLVSIFLFKNRPLQVRIGYLSIVFSVLLLVAVVMLFLNAGKVLDDSMQVKDELGVYFPPAAILFSILANYFVSKDEKLVDSSNRLR